jgi:hypothetical protein
VTLAIFHSKGTVALIMAILKIFVNEFVITGAAMRIILAGILSIPVDLRGFRDNRSLYTFDYYDCLKIKATSCCRDVILEISVTIIDIFGNIWTNIGEIIIKTLC